MTMIRQFRPCSDNIQNFQNIFRIFRQYSECSDCRFFSEFLAHTLVYSEFLDFVADGCLKTLFAKLRDKCRKKKEEKIKYSEGNIYIVY
jgi:hypothetical protein